MNKPALIDVARGREIVPSFSARFTTAEFVRMSKTGAFDDMTVELVAGELERMPPPGTAHANRQVRVILLLGSVIPADRLLGEVGLDLGDDTLLACDAAVTIAPIAATDRMIRAGDVALVVEVAETTAARDRGFKRLSYARAGVPVYWVIDGRYGVTYIHGDPRDGDYADVRTVRFGEPLPVPGTDAAIVIE